MRTPARQRLLDAAEELFYAEGVHTVGIDRVIEHAGVARGSLYNAFGSKDELVRAYLQRRADRMFARIEAAVERQESARDRLLAIFDAQADWLAAPTYNGCAFARAAAESPPDGVAIACSREYRSRLIALLTTLATEAGAPQPADLARQLLLLYDGTANAGRYERTTIAAVAKAAASAIVELALDPQSTRS
ncbi:TetR/AcrR family transcriptional regulator [Catenuloplanes japonicus]|uniref:TetR/AcrR family transcriptional regulator n=1 Tax=Catenuloplanes japonicus TaxID=33876 RepID=UPI000526B960|nr:TetR/AcrR family transcriptional regulator [Catenuloplanes japonicus]